MAPGSEDRYDIGNDDIKRHIITGFHGAAVDVLSLTTLLQMHVTLQNKTCKTHKCKNFSPGTGWFYVTC